MRKTGSLNITNARSGAAFAVWVIPGAPHTRLAELQEDGTIRIQVTAPPNGEQANAELVGFLADLLGIQPADVEIVMGQDSDRKLISVYSIGPQEVDEKLRAAARGEG
ncbi:MAG: hypothetical protein Kow00124_18520 [Anaerolineae bacterium]